MLNAAVPENVLAQLLGIVRDKGGRADLQDLRIARVCQQFLIVPAMRELIARKLVALIGDTTYQVIERLPVAAAARAARGLARGTNGLLTEAPSKIFSTGASHALDAQSHHRPAETGKMAETKTADTAAIAVRRALQGKTKHCAGCHTDLDRAWFGPHGRSADGLAAKCDPCRGRPAPDVYDATLPPATPGIVVNLPDPEALRAAIERNEELLTEMVTTGTTSAEAARAIAHRELHRGDAEWKGEPIRDDHVLSLPTINGVYCLVSPERGTCLINIPERNEDCAMRLGRARAVQLARFILRQFGTGLDDGSEVTP